MAKYGKKAGKVVRTAVKRLKKGTLKSGKSRKKVTSKKQVVAKGIKVTKKKSKK